MSAQRIGDEPDTGPLGPVAQPVGPSSALAAGLDCAAEGLLHVLELGTLQRHAELADRDLLHRSLLEVRLREVEAVAENGLTHAAQWGGGDGTRDEGENGKSGGEAVAHVVTDG